MLPLLWAPEEYWFRNQQELPWAVIKPPFEQVNALCCLLLCIIFLMIDGSVYGFHRKTSPYGGSPNIMYELCKPCEIGAMVRNGLDAITIFLPSVTR